jgi:hypothetical protein
VPNCIALPSTRLLRLSSVRPMDIKAIIARAELMSSRSEKDPAAPPGRASATLDALVSYLDAICWEWATTSEVDRLAAVRLAADTAKRIQAWVATGTPGGSA